MNVMSILDSINETYIRRYKSIPILYISYPVAEVLGPEMRRAGYDFPDLVPDSYVTSETVSFGRFIIVILYRIRTRKIVFLVDPIPGATTLENILETVMKVR